MTPPFRADQIGSLLRPANLISLQAEHDQSVSAGNVSDDIKRVTEDAITRIVHKQKELGICPMTDGEFWRTSFHLGFCENVHGFTFYPSLPVPGAFRTNWPPATILSKMGFPGLPAVVAEAKIEYTRSIYLDNWMFLRSQVPESEWGTCKMTMPSALYHYLALRPGKIYTADAYTSDREYLADLAAVYRQEIRTLYDAGLRNIQIDDPELTFLADERFREGFVIDGSDPEEAVEICIWATNEALKDKPKDMHIGIHLCRGNFTGSVHFAEGSYEWIAKRLFTMNYDTFYLEYDTSRAGTLEPMRNLPVGKNLVLGLVSTKCAELEDMGDLEQRVHEAAGVIARGQSRDKADVLADTLAVSPQCGFSSVSSGGATDMTEDRMWEKLLLVKRLAQRLWLDGSSK
jgi:methionine synthase II (cobalamin-independent)